MEIKEQWKLDFLSFLGDKLDLREMVSWDSNFNFHVASSDMCVLCATVVENIENEDDFELFMQCFQDIVKYDEDYEYDTCNLYVCRKNEMSSEKIDMGKYPEWLVKLFKECNNEKI